ncbi:MAG: hypothetical protein WCI97_01405 [Bacteroidota bacterium]
MKTIKTLVATAAIVSAFTFATAQTTTGQTAPSTQKQVTPVTKTLPNADVKSVTTTKTTVAPQSKQQINANTNATAPNKVAPNKTAPQKQTITTTPAPVPVVTPTTSNVSKPAPRNTTPVNTKVAPKTIEVKTSPK